MSATPKAFWEDELQRFLADPPKALEEALAYVCCPICQVLASLPFEFFRLLPARWEEEPGLREAVTASGGFCNHHTWRLAQMQSMVAVAVVFVDVLAGLAGQGPAAVEPCPVCRVEQLATQALLQLLAERLQDEAERERFGKLFGLCYPHWRALLDHDLPSPCREFLQQSQSACALQLQSHLQGFLDKKTVELKWTRTPDETRAARRAVLKTGGSEGI
jgi:hypothetical protein